jgi:hypothetical protein
MKRPLLCLTLALISSSSFAADDDRKGLDFFEAKIRPMLVKHCYECHSTKAVATKKLKGGLLLDSREAVRKGGESGPAVVPGKPGDSALIAALNHESFKMPPKGKLAPGVIADFVKWVEIGAPDPRTGGAVETAAIDIEAGRAHWAFQSLKAGQLPDVADKAWIKTAIDQFIRAKQESRGITPNAVASPTKLIRRVYFDLVGLPPEPADVERFVAEAKEDLPAAYDRLIDELLASEHYGERWARHWLDLARFAESNGYAFDGDRPNAFHYRDFVIRALNSDLPYNEFVQLQIAGDLLANLNPESNDQAKVSLDATAATGFLVAGPYTTQQTQKERERSRYEQLDDILNTLGTSLLGLTLGCSRCHDHKYDPLPSHDYYRLASCFAEVGFADTGINLDPEAFREAKAKYDAEHTPLVAARTKFEQEQLPARITEWLAERSKEPAAATLSNWHVIGPFQAANLDAALNQAFEPENAIDLKATYSDGKLKWTEQPDWKDGAVHNTLKGDNSAHYLHRTIESPTAQVVALSLGCDDGIKVWLNGREVVSKKKPGGAAADQIKAVLPLLPGANELLMKIANGGGAAGFYFKAAGDGTTKEIAALFDQPQDKWNDEQRQKVTDWFKLLQREWIDLDAPVAAHAKQEPKPTLTMSFAAKVRGSTYQFGDDTFKVYTLRRGNPDNKQDVAAPGFLQVLTTDEGGEKHWLNEEQQQARLALADWLTDTESGAGYLLARVIVNRLWHHHFGRGLVATPSDFGTRGERPTHPELLDWLAVQLVEGGWKLKPIHKLMMTSAVYMQAGAETAGGREHDLDNLLLWRRGSRRLEAEIIRDSLLAISGSLDRKLFGKGTLDQKNTRRSVYLTVKRGQLIPILQLFDAPDAMQAVGTRQESTVAPQALALLNSPFVRELAGKLATRVRPTNETPLADSIDQTYQVVVARKPSDDERSEMLAFIESQAATRGDDANAQSLAFHDFCHLLLCTNEFVYVD